MKQVYLDLGQGVHLSVIQGEGAMGSLGRGTVEVCLVGAKGEGLLADPVGHLDGKELAEYILTYLQDREVAWEYQ